MLKKLLDLILTLFLSAVLLEILLGLAFLIKDRNLEAMDVKDVPYLYYGFKKRAGTNRHGFKTSKSIEKAAGKYRIILVGGSVARSKGDPGESIASKLEYTLNEELQTDVIEVVNAGVSGYVLQQEFILIQMILQAYDADMIIGLDGFNDTYTYYLNYLDGSIADFDCEALPPHHWRDFKFIEQNKRKKSIFWRAISFFKNIERVVTFIEKKTNPVPDLPQQYVSKASGIYTSTLEDIRDFCSVKGIRYFNFLQPVRDYRSIPGVKPDQAKLLIQFQKMLERDAVDKSYVFDLTHIFDAQQELYTDYCHVNFEGNQVFANEMAKYLVPLLLQDEDLYFKLPKAAGGIPAE